MLTPVESTLVKLNMMHNEVKPLAVDIFLRRLFSLSRQNKLLFQALTDLIFLTISLILAMALKLDTFTFIYEDTLWKVLAINLPITIFLFFWIGLYQNSVRHISSKAIGDILTSVGLSATILFIISQITTLPIPRSVPIIYFLLSIFFIGGIRIFIRQFYFSRRTNGKPVAIYGAGEAGKQLFNALRQSLEYDPVIFIDDNPELEGLNIEGLPTTSFKVASKKLVDLKVSTILLAMPSITKIVRSNIFHLLEQSSIKVQSIPSMQDIIEAKVQINDLKDIQVHDLLGREPVLPIKHLMSKNITNKIVMVTGAGGSIGSELCRQILEQKPKKLILLESSEFALYKIHQELLIKIDATKQNILLVPFICSVQNKNWVCNSIDTYKIQTIYHAAAYKHVPLVEENIAEGIRNNVFGTENVIKSAIKHGVENVILISTDKAVRPTNFMGASKRIAELICQAHSQIQSKTKISIVRFGNVLGSSGSVIPQFHAQIMAGGPITLTHRDINRFFMTIKEAAELVIQAGSMAVGGETFVLDMGHPIKIIDLAEKMVRLKGLRPYVEEEDSDQTGDIAIKIIGLRPGEKLFEELLIGHNPMGTQHPRIMTAQEVYLEITELSELLSDLSKAIDTNNLKFIKELILRMPIGFTKTNVS